MNISKEKQKKYVNKLQEADKLIDEGAHKSAKRIINKVIDEINQIETDWEKWRKKNGSAKT